MQQILKEIDEDITDDELDEIIADVSVIYYFLYFLLLSFSDGYRQINYNRFPRICENYDYLDFLLFYNIF